MKRTLKKAWRGISIWVFVCYEFGSLLDYIFFSIVKLCWFIITLFLDCIFGQLYDFISFFMTTIILEIFEILKINLYYLADTAISGFKELCLCLPEKLNKVIVYIWDELRIFLNNLISSVNIVKKDLYHRFFK